MLKHAQQCAAAGVNFLQLREKDLPASELAELARAMLKVLRAESEGTRLLVNSRADVAVAVRADGVHLTSGEGELAPGQVRSVYAAAGLEEPIVSISCHTIAEVVRAREQGASLVLFGPVFEKVVAEGGGEETMVAGGTGIEALSAACSAAQEVPVLALGGVTEANAAKCVAAGAAGVAGIRLFAVGGRETARKMPGG